MHRHSEKSLSKRHPKIDSIIRDTIAQQLPRKLSCDPLHCILRSYSTITVRAADEATGYRYARSSIAEYTMLARIASKGIGNYIASCPKP